MYDYEIMSGDNKIALYTEYLNKYNPYSSRIMDYKYVVFEKE